jgi:hypothetical protein
MMLLAVVLGTVGVAEVQKTADDGAVWTVVANMTESKIVFGIAQLSDGIVLTAGGYKEDGDICATTSAYFQKNNSWVAMAPMNQMRYQVPMVNIGDGVVLVACGSGEEYCSVEVYNYSTNTWTNASGPPGMSYAYGLARLRDGQVLGVFGNNSETGTWVFLYDLVTDTWTETTSPLQPIEGYNFNALASISPNSVLGISDCCQDVNESAEVYVGDNATWYTVPTVNSFQCSFSVAALADGSAVLLAGGSNGLVSECSDGADSIGFPPDNQGAIKNASLYVVKTNSWTSITPTHFARSLGGLAALGNCSFLACGGRNANYSFSRWAEVLTLTNC